MLAKDEDALICDMAQYYHVFRMRDLPVKTLAILASGLPDDSRIKIAMSPVDTSPQMLLLSMIADRLGILAWMQSKDGAKNRNRPPSIVEAIKNARADRAAKKEIVSFSSGDAFLAAQKRLLGG